jgi:ribonucleotide reductase alpha subunit
MFLDDTACNLASMNLLQFYTAASSTSRKLQHATRLWTLTLEISVMMAQFPSKPDRAALLRLPHARPRLRQYRRPADDHPAFL